MPTAAAIGRKNPDTAPDGRLPRTVVGLNANNAGVYGTVVRTGTLRVGQVVRLLRHAQ